MDPKPNGSNMPEKKNDEPSGILEDLRDFAHKYIATQNGEKSTEAMESREHKAIENEVTPETAEEKQARLEAKFGNK